jgi:DNA end-binding protein Ku
MPRNSGAPEPQRGSAQSIAFGLVNVPVKVKTLSESKAKTSISANFICPDHEEKVKTKRYCEAGDHYPDAVKAYPVDGGYVQLDEDLLDQIVAAKTGELRIETFVPLEQIDPIYFKAPYLVYPGEGGAGNYDLLATAMRDAGRAAVGNAVFAGAKSTALIVLRFSEATGTLVAHSCVYDDAIRWGDVDLVVNAAQARPAPSAAHVQLAEQIIQGLEGDFDPTAVADTYTPALRDLLAQAAGGKTPKPAAKPQPTTQADDLMAALRDSVAAAKKTPKPKPAAKPKAAKKKAAA